MAKRAVEDGGSSYSDLNVLIEELRSHCPWPLTEEIANMVISSLKNEWGFTLVG